MNMDKRGGVRPAGTFLAGEHGAPPRRHGLDLMAAPAPVQPETGATVSASSETDGDDVGNPEEV